MNSRIKNTVSAAFACDLQRAQSGSDMFNRYESDECEFVIPDGVTQVGDLAFAGSGRLEKLVIPDSVRSIGNYAFMNCYSLREIRMPQYADHIGAGLFQNCWQLRKLVLPEGMKTLGSDMLENCHELTELTLPSSLKKVEKTAFSRCRDLKTIHIDPAQLEILPTSARYNAVLTYMEEHAAGDTSGIIDSYVRERQRSFLDLAINRKSVDAVRYMAGRKLADEEAIREYLKRSADSGRVEISAILLESLRQLPAESRQPWINEDPFV